MERLGSGRGYIWSRSIPLIKQAGFMGLGADTYPEYFPQNDFKGKDATLVYYKLERPLTMCGFENYVFKQGLNQEYLS